jgi:hypothetical protein
MSEEPQTNWQTLELHCLNAVTDDFENIESIERQVKRDINQEVARQDITTVIEGLCRRGLITAHRYDIGRRQFIAEHFSFHNNVEDFWFYINPEGRAVLESEWTE